MKHITNSHCYVARKTVKNKCIGCDVTALREKVKTTRKPEKYGLNYNFFVNEKLLRVLWSVLVNSDYFLAIDY